MIIKCSGHSETLNMLIIRVCCIMITQLFVAVLFSVLMLNKPSMHWCPLASGIGGCDFGCGSLFLSRLRQEIIIHFHGLFVNL